MSFLKSYKAEPLNLSKFGADNELFDLLYQIAYLGICRNFFQHSEVILTAYALAKPESVRMRIGMGLHAFSQRAYDTAITIFKDILKNDPKNDYAKAYLGLVYWKMDKPAEAKKVLNEIISANNQPEAVEFAKAIFEEIKKAA